MECPICGLFEVFGTHRAHQFLFLFTFQGFQRKGALSRSHSAVMCGGS